MQVPFLVQPKYGKFATNLKASDIVLLEDGVPKPAMLVPAGEMPGDPVAVDVVLLYDRCAIEPSPNREALLKRFPGVRINAYASMQTANLFTTIADGIRRFDRKRSALRVLVVYSTGETDVRADGENYESVMKAAAEAGVAIYPVYAPLVLGMSRTRRAAPGGDGSVSLAAMRRLMTTNNSVGQFLRLSDSGGQNLTKLPDIDLLETLLTRIAQSTRYAYVAGYQPLERDSESPWLVTIEMKDKAKGRVIGGRRQLAR